VRRTSTIATRTIQRRIEPTAKPGTCRAFGFAAHHSVHPVSDKFPFCITPQRNHPAGMKPLALEVVANAST